ncbi:MAG: hypothetical protein IIA67_09530 [Planctomycetes bacterium]|nr:hypothetical protein [Planctomycetota bacterium]
MNQPTLENLEIFTGQTTPTESRVYARLASGGLPDGCTLGGWIYGPSCEYARTLPAKISLHDLGDGDGLLAEAVVPDACCWTPRLPFLYDVTVRLRRGEEVLAEVQRPFGIRTLGARGRDLLLEGKRFVIRGGGGWRQSVAMPQSNAWEPRLWHDSTMAMLVDSPSDELCRQADISGVLLIARLAGRSDDAAARLRRLGCFASVAVVILDDEAARGENIGKPRSGILLAQQIRAGGSFDLPPWADVIVCDLSQADAGEFDISQVTCPVLMYRGADSPTSPQQARAACDQLQRDLAPLGQFAGYLV